MSYNPPRRKTNSELALDYATIKPNMSFAEYCKIEEAAYTKYCHIHNERYTNAVGAGGVSKELEKVYDAAKPDIVKAAESLSEE